MITVVLLRWNYYCQFSDSETKAQSAQKYCAKLYKQHANEFDINLPLSCFIHSASIY